MENPVLCIMGYAGMLQSDIYAYICIWTSLHLHSKIWVLLFFETDSFIQERYKINPK